MKPEQEQADDRLIDALLHQQSAGDQEQALLEIEKALDERPVPVVIPLASRWRHRMGIIAACVMIGCLVVLGFEAFEKSRKNSEAAEMAEARSKEIQERKNRQQELADLDQAIRDQEDQVEERRKVLATIVRTKAVVHHDQNAIGRGLDAQDYVDAKRDFETDWKHLMELRMRQINMGIHERIAASDPSPPVDFNPDRPLLPATAEAETLSADVTGRDSANLTSIQRESRPRVVPPPTPMAAASSNARGSANLAQLDLEVAQLRSDSAELRRKVDASNLETMNLSVGGKPTTYSDLAMNESGASRAAGRPNQPVPSSQTAQPGTMMGRQTNNEGFGEVSTLSSLSGGGNLGLGGKSRGSNFSMDENVRDFARQEKPNTERYGPLIDPKWQRPSESPLSTFSIDVDNASYSNIRRFIRDGKSIPPDAVRIEECINSFDYGYAKPAGDKAFAVHTTLATCPWNREHLLMKVGIKGREIPAEQRPVSNLVFLIDVSGSMQSSDKLPLVKESLKLLLHQLDERDSVSYVVYAGGQGVVLSPTKMTESGRATALEALGKLEAGGSTNGGAGIQRAYQIAREMFVKDGVNRVILATDGDFNVGITDQSQLVQLVKERAADNIYLSVLGFGTGNLNDALMESISKDGNGNHYYIDSIREGRKVLLQRLSGTLITIAKDVKIQIEFNPSKVGSYRLIGYANRQLRDEDFNNDKVDAGDIGAGHTVTAFYEIVPAGKPLPDGGGVDALKYQQPAEKPAVTDAGPGGEWLTLKLRHKSPEGDISSLQETVVDGPAIRWQDAGPDFSFASAVALFGMKLRGMEEARAISWEHILDLATPGLKNDVNEDRAEFIGLLAALVEREAR